MGPDLVFFLLFISISCVTCWSDNGRRHQYDYCVLGAGPAGLQMGYFLSRARRDYIILERSSGPGSFFHRFPRHRKLISINKIHTGSANKEFNLRHDWNSLLSDKSSLLFKRLSSEFYPPADTYPLYLSIFQKELGLKVQYGVDIRNVRAVQMATGVQYLLTDQQASELQCSTLLVATGLWVPQKVDFVGSELVEGYESISTNPEDYKDQTVLILGKGNSAFETAQSIMGRASFVHMLSPSPVRLAWQTHYVGDLRAVNNDLLDTYQLKSLDGLAEANLENIVIAHLKDGDSKKPEKKKKDKKKKKKKLYPRLNKFLLKQEGGKNTSEVSAEELSKYHIDNFSLREPYDRIIRCLGFRFNFSIFHSSARLQNSENAKGRLPSVTAWYEGENSPGLFVLGTAAHSRDYRQSAGGFIHGFRYTVRAVHRVLEYRNHRNPWTSTKLMTSQLQSWILKRVNEVSGLYQMVEVLGDVVLLQGSQCEYVEEFPIQALPQFTSLSGHKVSLQGLIVIIMQYGKKVTDTLGPDRARQINWTTAWRSSFLHPVLYHYDTLPTEEEMRLRPKNWALPRPKAIHHVVEDFLTNWQRPLSHIQPLQRFLEHCLQADLRSFYAESCFQSSLTHRRPPLFCQQGYLKQQGIQHVARPIERVQFSGLMPTKQDGVSSGPDPALANFLAQAGTPVSPGLRLDL
ncbi:FAD-dependent oxidoreductase domain-containing protein 2 [Cynoglossus semilaevis]|uniref:FAD-dependent oxidoreductase domain containing 2 n=1 Tax=Cynoglossus semilaevis TaxID=244447 RepID=A0A3P8W7T2_CYNSE|nr:FAD-dependent oxidoreductase domain-containing protein 2 [Cynoglossus semilaevis]XP_008328989.1 FAD-dependent oxidoreductase domain-containing protein 2 [Cynoglossus semilaevis]